MTSADQNKFLNPFRFEVQRQQTRQISVNLSLVTSVYNHNMTYQEILQFFKKYQSEHIKMENLHQSSNLKLKKYKEAIYYGEFVSNKREGIGIMFYNNGQIYQGEWSNDLRHGEGYEKFQNGCYYKGRYQYGKIQGIGVYKWVNGQVYEGQWVNNKKHGTGMMKNQKGDNYLGQWHQGQANGIGIFTQFSGNRYEGTFINFMKNGSGTQKFISGDLYKGQYKNGKFDGYGEYFWADGSYYKGHFKNGFKNGHGMWKRNRGHSDKYQGQFLNNKKEGYGIYTWQCGNIYKGNYHQNMRHGYGQIFWQDGGFYRGFWQNDLQQGQGQLFTGQQKLIKGTFKEGQLVSPQLAENQIIPNKKQVVQNRQRQKIRKILNTPIELISDLQMLQKYQQNEKQYRQIVVRKPYKQEQAKLIKLNLNNKTLNNFTLGPDSVLKKKLMQSLQLKHKIKTNSTLNSQTYKLPQKNKTLDKIPHSAFQIHRLHRNKAVNNPKNDHLSTMDNQIQFAFRYGENSRQTEKTRQRYFSRLS